jgi:hypothetical protein
MRTGDLDSEQDRYSEIWFANGFLRPLDYSSSATTFQGNFLQADGHWSWQSGFAHAAAGKLRYEDNDPVADNSRNVHYFQVELVQNLTGTEDGVWYAATRFSRITAEDGFPLVGNGDFRIFFFDNTRLARELWRFSIGAGYRIRRNLRAKMEYSFENGEQIDSQSRNRENLFAFEIAAGF